MILLGPVIGCVRNNTVTIGYEVSSQCMISVRVADSDRNEIYCQDVFSAPGKLSFTDVQGILTGSYTVSLTDKSERQSTRHGSFFMGDSVAVVSCDSGKSDALWNFMLKKMPSTCLHIGDNVYMDRTYNTAIETINRYQSNIVPHWDSVVDIYRQSYRDHWSTSHMSNVLSSCINVFLWDDHDVCDSWDQLIRLPNISEYIDTSGNINWILIAQDLNDVKQRAVIAGIQAYCEYQLPMSLGASAVHMPGSFTYHIGDREILFIDRRYSVLTSTPLLPVDYKTSGRPDMIVTGVPLFFLHPCVTNKYIDWLLRKVARVYDLHDHWILYPSSLQEILSIVQKDTVFFAGDVHMNGLTRITMHVGSTEYILNQVTSSAVSSDPTPYIIYTLLSIMRSFRVRIQNYECNVSHSSWTRENGYVTFDITQISSTLEYVLLSLVKATL